MEKDTGKDGAAMGYEDDESPGEGWGISPPGADGRDPADTRNIANGSSPELDEDEVYAGVIPGTQAGGRWVSRGGVLSWEEAPGTEGAAPDPQAEAESSWADDELALPPGAPASARIRAVRAWILGQRQRATEAIGTLLLEQRRYQSSDEEANTRQRGPAEESPLELAMVVHQAEATEYERLLERLVDLEAHNGPQRLLVEFYLELTDRLAELANAPEAPANFAPHLRTASASPAGKPSPRAFAEWEGSVEATLQTRRRVERMTAPESDD
jgi:hypothetical protein